jgi:sugar lactone lactonase YvrE
MLARNSTVDRLARLVVLGAGVWLAASPAPAQMQAHRILTSSAVVDGTGEQPMRWPVAIAAASDDEFAVADAWRPRLLVYRRVGASWTLERAVALPATPAALAHDGRRYLIALRGRSELAVVESDGSLGRRPLAKSVVPGALAALPNGALLVWDAASGRFLELRGDEMLVRGSSAETVTALTADGAAGWWAAIGEAGEVRRFDREGRLLATWKVPAERPIPAWPAGLAAEPAGRLFVLDRHGNRVVALDGEGQLAGVGSGRGWEPGLLMLPSGLARLPGGDLLVADQGNGRAQSFAVVGGVGR